MSTAPAKSAPAAKYFWHKQIRLVSVESGIAGGKSTLLQRLAAVVKQSDGLRAYFVQEPVDVWIKTGMLQAFYADPPRYAAEFQALTFSTRIGALSDAYHKALEHVQGAPDRRAVIVTERSPFADHDVFEHLQRLYGNIDEMQHRVYAAKFEAWERVVQRRAYDLYIWLNTPVDESQKRFAARERGGELVPDKYAHDLYARHTALLGHGQYRGAPVVTVDGAEPLHTDDAKVAAVWHAIVARLGL